MPAFSRVKTWSSGEVLTAANLNAEFDNIINNFTLTNLDDYSDTEAQMQETVSPGNSGSPSLPTNLSGELTRLRFMIKAIHGGAQWYASALTGWITTAMIGALQVTTAKLADLSVTTGKLADGSVTAVKLAVGAFSYANLPTQVMKQATLGSVFVTTDTYVATGGAGTSFTMTSLVRTSNVTACTLSATPTDVIVGQIYRISNATTTSFNGNWLVIGKNGNTLYLHNPGVDETGTIGAGTSDSGAVKEYVPAKKMGATDVIGSIQRTANVVTVTPGGGFGQTLDPKVGQKVLIAAPTGTFNGMHTVTSVNTGVSFTYAQTGADETGTPSSGTCYAILGVQITTNGRPTKVELGGGAFKLLAVTSTAEARIRIYRPTVATYNINSTDNMLMSTSIRGVSDFTDTTTPSTVYVSGVDGSFSVTDSIPLVLAVTATRQTKVPLSSYSIIEPVLTAGTYDYIATVCLSDELGNVYTTSDTATLVTAQLVAYEF